MSTSPEGIYEPGIIDPGFPVNNSTQPFWLSEPSPISKLRSQWLDSADIVIIGSGMTSVSLCRTLYANRPDLRIVVVDARDLCSGATGRNGGHIKAMSPGVWFDRKPEFGVAEAIKIMEYEQSHLDEMVGAIKENEIDCDLHVLEGLDIYHDTTIFDRAVRALEDMEKHSPKLAARYTVYHTRDELRARNLGDHVVGAIGMPAASMWPYKLVTKLFEKMVKRNGLSIQTNTRVTGVTESADYATVKTDRGEIRATHVVHATNCWIGHLVPELRAFVSPVRANVQRQVPHLPGSPGLKTNNSFWLRYGEHDYDYMIQRPDGAYIMGRANTSRRATSDDSNKDLLPHSHLRGTLPLLFDFKTEGNKMDVTHAWSGSVAFTLDGVPFVGQLPFKGRKHQWVSAAYQGIGMVRAFRTAQMLGLMILEKEIPDEYPRSMLLSEKRLSHFNAAVKEAQVKAKL